MLDTRTKKLFALVLKYTILAALIEGKSSFKPMSREENLEIFLQLFKDTLQNNLKFQDRKLLALSFFRILIFGVPIKNKWKRQCNIRNQWPSNQT